LTAQNYRCRVSGATGENDYTPTPQKWNRNRNQITRRPDKISDTGPEYQSGQFCVARPARIPISSRCLAASRILTWSHQQPHSHLSTLQLILSLIWTPRLFCRRSPWHPQARQRLQPRGSDISPPLSWLQHAEAS